MKKWLSHLTIVTYLGALAWGMFAHTAGVGLASHPVMYFIVWDMFCGWSAFESRTEIIGEGESGKYYELSPGPWDEILPFGSIGRRHYDVTGNFAPRMALNTLRHTNHEPMTRIFIVDVAWAKMYNLPESLWAKRFERPRDFQKYYQVRHILTPEGVLLHTYPHWISHQYAMAMGDNPRLMADVRKSKPFYAFGSADRPSGTYLPGTSFDPRSVTPVGSLLGN